MKTIERLPALRDDRAQTMTEYVVVLGVITVPILFAMGALSNAVAAGIDAVVALYP